MFRVAKYLIKWQGWSKKHNTWEPRGNLECPVLLEEFEAKLVGNKTNVYIMGFYSHLMFVCECLYLV